MRVDYDQIAPDYDTHRRGRGPYFQALVDRLRAAPPGRVLEVGAGTGNNTAPVLAAIGRAVVALEPSRGMAGRAREKGVAASWVRGSGEALPFRSGAFAAVYGTYMLHHIRDLRAMFTACRTVLAPGGVAVFVTVPETFIAAHPMNRYFPGFARIDLARFQPISEVEAALRDAGFAQVTSENTVETARPIDADYVEKVAGRFISTYDLLPRDEFAAGLARLRAEVAASGSAGAIAREATLVWGYR